MGCFVEKVCQFFEFWMFRLGQEFSGLFQIVRENTTDDLFFKWLHIWLKKKGVGLKSFAVIDVAHLTPSIGFAVGESFPEFNKLFAVPDALKILII